MNQPSGDLRKTAQTKALDDNFATSDRLYGLSGFCNSTPIRAARQIQGFAE